MTCPHLARTNAPLQYDGDPTKNDPLVVTFAHVVVCVQCNRPVGDVTMLRAGHPKPFNKTSWALMLKVHPWPPYNFKIDAAGKMLLPATYDEETTAS